MQTEGTTYCFLDKTRRCPLAKGHRHDFPVPACPAAVTDGPCPRCTLLGSIRLIAVALDRLADSLLER